jgi:putative cardiolipin synthase
MLSGCAGLPNNVERMPSNALENTAETRLGRALAPAATTNPGRTGVYPLVDARDAFAARMLLARAADRCLDVQYYIWRDDTTGALLNDALWEAAERGVRVRLLLDDQNTAGLDETIAALDSHPNIEVRLFNPFANRHLRVGDFVTDFARVNRRMHNKSFTADNQATIVGGRNVGDEYFGADSPVAFADLDVLAAGSVVREVSAGFDAYWNSESAWPASALIRASQGGEPASAPWAIRRDGAQAAHYTAAVRETPLLRQLLARELPLQWVPARVVQDDPSKVLHPPERDELHMLPRLEAALGKPGRELDLISPYFVPTQGGTAGLIALAARGVRVRVLTNSLAATDVTPVHAGYAKYREALLRGGARLYELKPLRHQDSAERQRSGGGSSSASLHAKTFAVDRSRLYVGSFNLDPRSARLNTEMGVVIDSAPLSTSLADAFDGAIPHRAYELRLTDFGIEWIERGDAGEARHASEPGAGLLRRLWIGLLSLLPIEWLL